MQNSWNLGLFELGKEIVEQALNQLSLTGKEWMEVYRRQANYIRYLLSLRKEGDGAHGGAI